MIAQEQNGHLEEHLMKAHQDQIKRCLSKGEEDGRRQLPAVASKISTPFEYSLQPRYQADIEQVHSVARQELDSIRDLKYTPAKHRLAAVTDELVDRKVREAEAEMNTALRNLEDNHLDKLKEIENAPDWIAARRRFEAIRERFLAAAAKHGREELHIAVRPAWAIPLLIAVALCEIPLNFQAFLAFRDSQWMTFLFALSLVVLMPALSHQCGKFLRQARERRAYWVYLFLGLVIMGGLNYFTAVFRSEYLRSKGFEGFLIGTSVMIFFAISMALFFIGIMIAYLMHDQSLEFVKVHQAYHREKALFERAQALAHGKSNAEKADFMAKKEALQEKFAREKAEALHLSETLFQAMHQAKSEYQRALRHYQGLEQQIAQGYLEAVQQYRDANLTFRTNHAQPQAWQAAVPGLTLRLAAVEELD